MFGKRTNILKCSKESVIDHRIYDYGFQAKFFEGSGSYAEMYRTKHMGVSSNGGTLKTPQMIILVGKCIIVGYHRKPPHDAHQRTLILFQENAILQFPPTSWDTSNSTVTYRKGRDHKSWVEREQISVDTWLLVWWMRKKFDTAKKMKLEWACILKCIYSIHIYICM